MATNYDKVKNVVLGVTAATTVVASAYVITNLLYKERDYSDLLVESAKKYVENNNIAIGSKYVTKAVVLGENLPEDIDPDSCVTITNVDGEYNVLQADTCDELGTLINNDGEMSYTIGKSFDEEGKLTNQDVLVSIYFEEEIEAVEGWTLSSDGMTLTKVVSSNGTFNFQVQSKGGNVANVVVVVDNIDKDAPVITINGNKVFSRYDADVTLSITDKNIDTVTLDGVELSKEEMASYTVLKQSKAVTHLVVAVDKAGNETTAKFTIAPSVPKVSISRPAENAVVNDFVQFGFSGDGTLYTLDEAGNRIAERKINSGAAKFYDEGRYELFVENSKGQTASRRFTIDKTAPVIKAVAYTIDEEGNIVEGAEITNGQVTNLNVKFYFSDTLSDVIVTRNDFDDYLINGEEFTEEGTYIIHVEDGAGNLPVDKNGNEVESFTFTINRKAPKFTGVEDGGLYNKEQTITFNEGTATLNGEDYASGTSIPEGKYEFTITDGINSNTIHFEIDRTKPVFVGFDENEDTKIVKGNFIVKGSDKNLDFFSVDDVKVEGESIELVDEGTYKLLIADKANNRVIKYLTIDKTAPVITIDGETYQTGSHTRPADKALEELTFTASDNLTGYTAYIDGKDEENIYNPETPLSNGVHTLYVVDGAGNETSVTFTIMSSAPGLTIDGKEYTTDAKIVSNKDVVISFANLSAIETARLTGENLEEDITDFSNGYTIVVNKDNEVFTTYTLTVKDLSGSTITVTIVIDNITSTANWTDEKVTFSDDSKIVEASIKVPGSDTYVPLTEAQIAAGEYALTVDGEYALTIKDEAGNENTHRYTKDTTAPKYSVSYTENGTDVVLSEEQLATMDKSGVVYFKHPVTIKFEDDYTGIEVMRNNETLELEANSKVYEETLNAGKYAFVVNDTKNINKKKSITIIVDNTAPVVRFTKQGLNAEGNPAESGEKIVSILLTMYVNEDYIETVADPNSTISWIPNGQDANTHEYMYVATITSSTSQVTSGEVTVTDKAGNAVTSEYDVTLDDRAAVVEIVEPATNRVKGTKEVVLYSNELLSELRDTNSNISWSLTETELSEEDPKAPTYKYKYVGTARENITNGSVIAIDKNFNESAPLSYNVKGLDNSVDIIEDETILTDNGVAGTSFELKIVANEKLVIPAINEVEWTESVNGNVYTYTLTTTTAINNMSITIYDEGNLNHVDKTISVTGIDSKGPDIILPKDEDGNEITVFGGSVTPEFGDDAVLETIKLYEKIGGVYTEITYKLGAIEGRNGEDIEYRLDAKDAVGNTTSKYFRIDRLAPEAPKFTPTVLNTETGEYEELPIIDGNYKVVNSDVYVKIEFVESENIDEEDILSDIDLITTDKKNVYLYKLRFNSSVPSFQFKDKVGNVTVTDSYQVNCIDKSAPTMNKVENGRVYNANDVKNGELDLADIIDDNNFTVKINLGGIDGELIATYSKVGVNEDGSSKYDTEVPNVSDLADGTYRIEVMDIAGNKLVYYFTIKVTPPVITLPDAPAEGEEDTRKRVPSLSGEGTAIIFNKGINPSFTNGPALLEKWDESANDYVTVNDAFAEWTRLDNPDEDIEYRITVTDKAGNVSTEVFRIDRIVPRLVENGITNNVPAGHTYMNEGGEVTFEFTEAVTPVDETAGYVPVDADGHKWKIAVADNYDLAYAFEDAAGNGVSGTYTVSFIDKVDPTITAGVVTDKQVYNSKNIDTLGIKYGENTGDIEYSDNTDTADKKYAKAYLIVDNDERVAYDKSLLFDENGKYKDGSYRIVVEDDAGNSTSVSFEIRVTLPSITFDKTEVLETTSGKLFNGEVRPIFEGKGTLYNVTAGDTEGTLWTTNMPLGVVDEENPVSDITYRLVVEDNFKNTNEVTFRVDNVKPSATSIVNGYIEDGVIKPLEDGKFINQDGVVTFVMSEAVTLVTESTNVTKNADGNIEVKVAQSGKIAIEVKDLANNVSKIEYTVSFIDRVAPRVTFDNTNNVKDGLYNGPVNITIQEDNIEKAVFTLNGGVEQEIALDPVLNDLGEAIPGMYTAQIDAGDGDYTIEVVDKAGNKYSDDETNVTEFTIDSVASDIKDYIPIYDPEADEITTENVTVTIKIDELITIDLGSCPLETDWELLVDEETNEPIKDEEGYYTYTKTVSYNTDEIVTVYYTDDAGNFGSFEYEVYNIDREAPTITPSGKDFVETDDQGTIYTGDVKIRVEDEENNIEKVTYKLSGTEGEGTSVKISGDVVEFTLPYTVEGTYVITATDYAGHSHSIDVKVDKDAPKFSYKDAYNTQVIEGENKDIFVVDNIDKITAMINDNFITATDAFYKGISGTNEGLVYTYTATDYANHSAQKVVEFVVADLSRLTTFERDLADLKAKGEGKTIETATERNVWDFFTQEELTSREDDIAAFKSAVARLIAGTPSAADKAYLAEGAIEDAIDALIELTPKSITGTKNYREFVKMETAFADMTDAEKETYVPSSVTAHESTLNTARGVANDNTKLANDFNRAYNAIAPLVAKTTVTVTSVTSNGNKYTENGITTSYAKEGDKITVAFRTDATRFDAKLNIGDVEITNNTIEEVMGADGKVASYRVIFTVPAGANNETVKYTIVPFDAPGNEGITESKDEAIIVDTTLADGTTSNYIITKDSEGNDVESDYTDTNKDVYIKLVAKEKLLSISKVVDVTGKEYTWVMPTTDEKDANNNYVYRLKVENNVANATLTIKDYAGNINTSTTYEVTGIDKVKPFADTKNYITINGVETVYGETITSTNQNVTIKLSSDKKLSYISSIVDDSDPENVVTYNWDMKDGELAYTETETEAGKRYVYTVTVRSNVSGTLTIKDLVENTSSATYAVSGIDKTPADAHPSYTTVTKDEDGNIIKDENGVEIESAYNNLNGNTNTYVYITLTSDKKLSAISDVVDVNNKTYSWVVPTNLQPDEDGNYIYKIKVEANVSDTLTVTDELGNEGTVEVTVNGIDTAVPIITINGTPYDTIKNIYKTQVSVSVSETNIKEMYYTLNGSSEKHYFTSTTLGLDSEGVYVITVTDKAGNTDSKELTIDLLAPSVVYTDEKKGIVLNDNGTDVIVITSKDEIEAIVNGLVKAVDNVDKNPVINTPVQISDDGLTYTYTATDHAGYTSVAKVVRFRLINLGKLTEFENELKELEAAAGDETFLTATVDNIWNYYTENSLATVKADIKALKDAVDELKNGTKNDYIAQSAVDAEIDRLKATKSALDLNTNEFGALLLKAQAIVNGYNETDYNTEINGYADALAKVNAAVKTGITGITLQSALNDYCDKLDSAIELVEGAKKSVVTNVTFEYEKDAEGNDTDVVSAIVIGTDDKKYAVDYTATVFENAVRELKAINAATIGTDATIKLQSVYDSRRDAEITELDAAKLNIIDTPDYYQTQFKAFKDEIATPELEAKYTATSVATYKALIASIEEFAKVENNHFVHEFIEELAKFELEANKLVLKKGISSESVNVSTNGKNIEDVEYVNGGKEIYIDFALDAVHTNGARVVATINGVDYTATVNSTENGYRAVVTVPAFADAVLDNVSEIAYTITPVDGNGDDGLVHTGKTTNIVIDNTPLTAPEMATNYVGGVEYNNDGTRKDVLVRFETNKELDSIKIGDEDVTKNWAKAQGTKVYSKNFKADTEGRIVLTLEDKAGNTTTVAYQVAGIDKNPIFTGNGMTIVSEENKDIIVNPPVAIDADDNNVDVILASATKDGSEYDVTGYTKNDEGKYVLNLSAGTYVLTFAVDGYPSITKDVTVTVIKVVKFDEEGFTYDNIKYQKVDYSNYTTMENALKALVVTDYANQAAYNAAVDAIVATKVKADFTDYATRVKALRDEVANESKYTVNSYKTFKDALDEVNAIYGEDGTVTGEYFVHDLLPKLESAEEAMKNLALKSTATVVSVTTNGNKYTVEENTTYYAMNGQQVIVNFTTTATDFEVMINGQAISARDITPVTEEDGNVVSYNAVLNVTESTKSMSGVTYSVIPYDDKANNHAGVADSGTASNVIIDTDAPVVTDNKAVNYIKDAEGQYVLYANDGTRKNVFVRIDSNEELSAIIDGEENVIADWTKDVTVYTFETNEDIVDKTVIIRDLAGNETSISIDVRGINKAIIFNEGTYAYSTIVGTPITIPTPVATDADENEVSVERIDTTTLDFNTFGTYTLTYAVARDHSITQDVKVVVLKTATVDDEKIIVDGTNKPYYLSDYKNSDDMVEALNAIIDKVLNEKVYTTQESYNEQVADIIATRDAIDIKTDTDDYNGYATFVELEREFNNLTEEQIATITEESYNARKEAIEEARKLADTEGTLVSEFEDALKAIEDAPLTDKVSATVTGVSTNGKNYTNEDITTYYAKDGEYVYVDFTTEAPKVEVTINGKVATVTPVEGEENAYRASLKVVKKTNMDSEGITYTITPYDENDKPGNAKTATDEHIILDTVAPGIESETITPEGPAKKKIASITLNEKVICTNLASSKVSVSEDGRTLSVERNVEGSFAFKYTDLAGNSVRYAVNITGIDNDAPEGTIGYFTKNEDGSYVEYDNTATRENVYIRLIASEKLKEISSIIDVARNEYEWDLSNPDTTTVEGKFIYTVMVTDDVNKGTLIFTDEAGNTNDGSDDATKIEYMVSGIDGVAPTIELDRAAEVGTNIYTSSVDVTITEKNIKSYTVNGEEQDTTGIVDGVLNVSFSTAGTYKLVVEDFTGAKDEVTFVVDLAIPVIKLDGKEEDVTITVNSESEIAANMPEVTVSDDSDKDITSKLVTTTSEDVVDPTTNTITRVITYTVKDHADKDALERTVTIIIDKNYSFDKDIVTSYATYVGKDVTVTVPTATNADGDKAEVEFASVTDADKVTRNENVFTFSEAGTYIITYRVVGYESITQAITVTVIDVVEIDTVNNTFEFDGVTYNPTDYKNYSDMVTEIEALKNSLTTQDAYDTAVRAIISRLGEQTDLSAYADRVQALLDIEANRDKYVASTDFDAKLAAVKEMYNADNKPLVSEFEPVLEAAEGAIPELKVTVTLGDVLTNGNQVGNTYYAKEGQYVIVNFTSNVASIEDLEATFTVGGTVYTGTIEASETAGSYQAKLLVAKNTSNVGAISYTITSYNDKAGNVLGESKSETATDIVIDTVGVEATVEYYEGNVTVDPETLEVTGEPYDNENGSTRNDVTIVVTADDDGSTIESDKWTVTRANGKVVYTLTVSENGTGSLVITDKAGNETTAEYEVNGIDKSPVFDMTNIPTSYVTYVDGQLTVTVPVAKNVDGTSAEVEFVSVTNPDNVLRNENVFTFGEKGTYTITYRIKGYEDKTQTITVTVIKTAVIGTDSFEHDNITYYAMDYETEFSVIIGQLEAIKDTLSTQEAYDESVKGLMEFYSKIDIHDSNYEYASRVQALLDIEANRDKYVVSSDFDTKLAAVKEMYNADNKPLVSDFVPVLEAAEEAIPELKVTVTLGDVLTNGNQVGNTYYAKEGQYVIVNFTSNVASIDDLEATFTVNGTTVSSDLVTIVAGETAGSYQAKLLVTENTSNVGAITYTITSYNDKAGNVLGESKSETATDIVIDTVGVEATVKYYEGNVTIDPETLEITGVEYDNKNGSTRNNVTIVVSVAEDDGSTIESDKWTVTRANGKVVYTLTVSNNAAGTGSLVITDKAGNETTVDYEVNGIDIFPVFDTEGTFQYVTANNKALTVSVPSASYADGTNAEVEFVSVTNSDNVLRNENTFTFSEAGTYTITYRAVGYEDITQTITVTVIKVVETSTDKFEFGGVEYKAMDYDNYTTMVNAIRALENNLTTQEAYNEAVQNILKGKIKTGFGAYATRVQALLTIKNNKDIYTADSYEAIGRKIDAVESIYGDADALVSELLPALEAAEDLVGSLKVMPTISADSANVNNTTKTYAVKDDVINVLFSSTFDLSTTDTIVKVNGIEVDGITKNGNNYVATISANKLSDGAVSYTIKPVTTDGIEGIEVGPKSTSIIVDKTAPELSIIYKGTAYSKDFTATIDAANKAFVASDYFTVGADVKLTSSDVVLNVPKNGYKVVYTVSDDAGNSTSITITVNVVDNSAPVITLNGEATVKISLNGTYIDAGATVTDNVDATRQITGVGNVDVTTAGTYVIRYNASDVAGNSAQEVTRTVIVEGVAANKLFRTINTCRDESLCYSTYTSQNYVWYSGHLWRLVAVNLDQSVKLITEDSQAGFSYSNRTSAFLGSNVQNWLENEFMPSLNNYNTMIATPNKEKYGQFCNHANNTYGIKYVCDAGYDAVSADGSLAKIGLLTIDEYRILGGKNGYLNNGERFFTMTRTSDSTVWIVDENGNEIYNLYTDEPYAIRPVINIKPTNVIKGTGTASDPYVIDEGNAGAVGDALTTRYSGEYVDFGGKTWRVVSSSNEGTKLIADEYVSVNGTAVTMDYGTAGNYDTSLVSGYLNTTFLKELEGVQSKMSLTKWNNHKYLMGQLPDMNNGTSTEKSYYVGLIRAGELMSGNSSTAKVKGLASWTMSSTNTESWFISSSGTSEYVQTSEQKGLRPVITLKNNVKITGGNGSYNSPFTVE